MEREDLNIFQNHWLNFLKGSVIFTGDSYRFREKSCIIYRSKKV